MPRRGKIAVGRGLVNSIINNLPVELHIPGYRYCGPGTKLKKRLARGDAGINALDEACKWHDIAYSQYKDLDSRHEADQLLAERADKIRKSPGIGLGEKIAAWGVSNIMKGKVKAGMGLQFNTKKQKKKSKCKCHGTKKPAKASQSIQHKKKNLDRKIYAGGFLPLLLPALGALGGLIGATSGIVRAVKSSSNEKKQLAEARRHNAQMEAIAMGSKNGKGLYLTPYPIRDGKIKLR